MVSKVIGYTIKPLGPTGDRMIAMQWGVIKDNPESRDRDNGAYLVTLSVRDEYTCSCPHFRLRLRDTRTLCKHCEWCRDLNSQSQVQVDQPAAETPPVSPPVPEQRQQELW